MKYKSSILDVGKNLDFQAVKCLMLLVFYFNRVSPIILKFIFILIMCTNDRSFGLRFYIFILIMSILTYNLFLNVVLSVSPEQYKKCTTYKKFCRFKLTSKKSL